jgi:hypothetical protein
MQAEDGTGSYGHLSPKHVWVSDPGFSRALRMPGVVLDQRRGQDGWEVLVAYGEGGGNIKPRAHMEWMPADRVTAVDQP